ncbi:hypothetical protein GCM10010377_80940 [Streptomyces viridiviolaceus]|nr:hypothetical protein GCM10010377_80940 [Streptomyces viridiviolaceus]
MQREGADPGPQGQTLDERKERPPHPDRVRLVGAALCSQLVSDVFLLELRLEAELRRPDKA